MGPGRAQTVCRVTHAGQVNKCRKHTLPESDVGMAAVFAEYLDGSFCWRVELIVGPILSISTHE